MEQVTLGGVEYVKASVIAKRFRYTSDYIGQLCRGRKVDAQLVGRTWYVNPRSLEAHRSGRYEVQKSSEKISNYKPKEKKSRIAVIPNPGSKTVKIIASAAPKANFEKRIEWKPVKYDRDDFELIPPLREVGAEQKLTVELAEAGKVKIRTLEKPQQLVADSLPEVSMTGQISVNSLDISYDEEATDTPPAPPVLEVVERDDSALKLKSSRSGVPSKPLLKPKSVAPKASEERFTYQVPINEGNLEPKLDFVPTRVKERERSKELTTETPTSSLRLVWLGLVVFGLILSAFLFESSYTFTMGMTFWSLQFSLPF